MLLIDGLARNRGFCVLSVWMKFVEAETSVLYGFDEMWIIKLSMCNYWLFEICESKGGLNDYGLWVVDTQLLKSSLRY